MISALSSQRRRTTGAFSLVEVTVALAICATGVLLLLSLMTLSLGSLSESSDRNAEARIRQAISSRYAMIDWNILEEWARTGHAEDLHFDFAGTEVPASDVDRTYLARVAVGDRATLSGDDDANRFIRTLEIRVTSVPERSDALTNPEYHDTMTVSLGNEAKLKQKYRD